MVYVLLAGGTLLRTQHALLPRTFCRYKSITQAIEQGRRRASDVFPPGDFPPPTRTRTRQSDRATILNKRPEPRGEQFGTRNKIYAKQRETTTSGSSSRSAGRPTERGTWPSRETVERSESASRHWRPHPAQGGEKGHAKWKAWRDKKEFKEGYRRPGVYSDAPREGYTAKKKRAMTTKTMRMSPSMQPAETQRFKIATSYVDVGPESLPFTTAASEFIYGTASVLAAIKGNRRKLYRLYVHSKRGAKNDFMDVVRERKLFGITHEVGDEYIQAMDKASRGRPHNGVVLESSPLPIPPITSLLYPHREDQYFCVSLGTQSAEDLLVNGKNDKYQYNSEKWRFPLILYVDGVLDEGNLGAIARSAYFLGVNAIVTFAYNTAPWSHIALKAAAGAAEAIPIFKVASAHEFLKASSDQGWRIYASDAVQAEPNVKSESNVKPLTSDAVYTGAGRIVYAKIKNKKREQLTADHYPVAQHPTILMMGCEATGLKASLRAMAHYTVGIKNSRSVTDIGVDSLNVSVAASLLCYEMIRKPKAGEAPVPQERLF